MCSSVTVALMSMMPAISAGALDTTLHANTTAAGHNVHRAAVRFMGSPFRKLIERNPPSFCGVDRQ